MCIIRQPILDFSLLEYFATNIKSGIPLYKILGFPGNFFLLFKGELRVFNQHQVKSTVHQTNMNCMGPILGDSQHQTITTVGNRLMLMSYHEDWTLALVWGSSCDWHVGWAQMLRNESHRKDGRTRHLCNPENRRNTRNAMKKEVINYLKFAF